MSRPSADAGNTTAGAAAAAFTIWPYVALTAAALFWGGTWPIMRAMLEQFPPMTQVFMRWAVALVVLAPLAWRDAWRMRHAIRADWVRLTLFALTGVTGFNMLAFYGLTDTTAVNGALLNAASPMLMLVFAAVGLRERIGWAQLLGMLISMAGVLTIITHGIPARIMALDVNVGDLWVLAAIVSWTTYTFLLKRWPVTLRPLTFMLVNVAIGLPPMLIGAAIELALGATMQPEPVSAVAGMLYLGLLPSIGAYLCWSYGVPRVGPSRASLFQYLIPVFAAVIAVTAFGESVQLFHLAGAGLIIGGIVLANRRRA